MVTGLTRTAASACLRQGELARATENATSRAPRATSPMKGILATGFRVYTNPHLLVGGFTDVRGAIDAVQSARRIAERLHAVRCREPFHPGSAESPTQPPRRDMRRLWRTGVVGTEGEQSVAATTASDATLRCARSSDGRRDTAAYRLRRRPCPMGFIRSSSSSSASVTVPTS
jgi:hypothetical protein